MHKSNDEIQNTLDKAAKQIKEALELIKGLRGNTAQPDERSFGDINYTGDLLAHHIKFLANSQNEAAKNRMVDTMQSIASHIKSQEEVEMESDDMQDKLWKEK